MQLVTITVKKSTGVSRFDYATYWVLTVKVVTKTQCNSIQLSSTDYNSSTHLRGSGWGGGGGSGIHFSLKI